MRSPRLGAGLTATLLTFALVACGNDSAGAPPAASTPPPAPPASTPTTVPTPTVTVTPIRSTQKYGDLTLVLDHTARPPANVEAALEAYEEFERAAHESAATNVEDPNLAKKSVGAPLAYIRDELRKQKVQKARSGGTVTVTIKLIRAGKVLTAFSSCYDQSKATLIRADGTSYKGPGAAKYPRMLLTVIVSQMDGLRRVTEYSYKAANC